MSGDYTSPIGAGVKKKGASWRRRLDGEEDKENKEDEEAEGEDRLIKV